MCSFQLMNLKKKKKNSDKTWYYLLPSQQNLTGTVSVLEHYVFFSHKSQLLNTASPCTHVRLPSISHITFSFGWYLGYMTFTCCNYYKRYSDLLDIRYHHSNYHHHTFTVSFSAKNTNRWIVYWSLCTMKDTVYLYLITIIFQIKTNI